MIRKRRSLSKQSRHQKHESILRAPTTAEDKRHLIFAHTDQRAQHLHHHLRARTWGMVAALICFLFIFIGWLLTIKIQIQDATATSSVSLWSIVSHRLSSWRDQTPSVPIILTSP